MSADSQGGVDYTSVLADLKARRAQLDSMISMLEAFVAGGLPPLGGLPSNSSDALPTNGAPVSNAIESDTFFGLSITEAAKKFLAMRKKPASVGEIVDALRRGGQQNSTSTNYQVTVGAILHRSYREGAGVIRVSRGMWGLADWYPNKARKPAGSGSDD